MHGIDLGATLIIYYFSLSTYISHRFTPIKHRGEFQQYAICLFHHFIEDFQYIWRTIGYAVSPAPMHVTTGWVEKDQVGMIQLMQIFHTIATDNLDMMQTQTFVILR